MTQRSTRIAPRHDLTAQEIDALEERLYAHNAAATGFSDGAGLSLVAECDGELVGAVAGYSWGGICELRQVWVREDQRGEGLGRKLMEAAIAEARRRGCAHVLLATYDFQAPDFYRRLGFETVAEVPDKPVGRSEFIMRLSLATGPA
jgi:N-acetylglutamate synthase-like GNAT family acetyltransferase